MTEDQHIEYEWRGAFTDDDLAHLHARAFGVPPRDHGWSRQVQAHSLGWVTARREGRLLGFVNVAWDGSHHAFLIDAIVHPDEQGHGIGKRLVLRASEGARAAGCEWLHVDYDEALEHFYVDRCGFRPTSAAVLAF